MKKYTMDDFIVRDIAVRVGKENVKQFLKMCEKRGMKWNSGDSACDYTPPAADDLCIVFGTFGAETLSWGNSERFACKGFRVVDFHDITAKSRHRYQIIIDCDGDTTTAKMIVNGKEVKTAQAKRNPADKFNVRIGAEFAFERLWKEQKAEKPAKQPKKKSGVFKVGDRVVCTGEQSGNVKVIGVHGRVVHVDKDDFLSVGVEFDKDISGHDCYHRAKEGYGYWMQPSNLRHE